MNKPTTRYYYDGQMGFEDDSTIQGGQEVATTVTRYALGAAMTSLGLPTAVAFFVGFLFGALSTLIENLTLEAPLQRDCC